VTALVISSFVIGMIFAVGLALSEMVNPARVLGFLDVTGRWDPTLLLVMVGALAITVPVYPLILRRARPLLYREFALPTGTKIDQPLVLGAAIFGIGWGLGGFCPGPALAGLASGLPDVIMFVTAMIGGQWLASRFDSH
jgi:uncharacterized protein